MKYLANIEALWFLAVKRKRAYAAVLKSYIELFQSRIPELVNTIINLMDSDVSLLAKRPFICYRLCLFSFELLCIFLLNTRKSVESGCLASSVDGTNNIFMAVNKHRGGGWWYITYCWYGHVPPI